MATQQELQEAFNLVELYSNASGDFGRDYGNAKSKAAKAAFESAGGQGRLAQLATDPQIAAELAKLQQSGGGFLSGLLKGIGTFVSEPGVTESLMLAGAAMGLNAMGAFGSGASGAAAAAPSATGMGAFTAEQLAAPVMSAGAPTLGAGTLGGLAGYTAPLGGATEAGITAAAAPAAGAGTTAADLAGATGTGTSWMDYLSTGLGLVQGVSSITGGNDINATGAQNATDPFAPYRAQYAQQLNQLMSNPSSVTSLPGYQFQQDQGQQAIERSLSAQGRTVSGQEQLELQKYGQGLAGQYYNDQYNKLAQLSGASANPAAGGSAYNEATAGNQAQQQSGWGQLGTLAAGAMTPNTPVNRAVTGAGDYLSNLWR